MKLQSLAVIAILIILPMSILLEEYTSNQIKTIQLQTSYDNRLTGATYDAIKAFQLNMSNSSTSDIANSKIRDLTAATNVFYNSLANAMNMSGYGEDVLQNYVPALVYTLYDGFYIYSNYENTLTGFDEEDKVVNDNGTPSNPSDDIIEDRYFDDDTEYIPGDDLYGMKPYVYYSCRYKIDNNNDFVITYSLDSYITIQGIIDGNVVNDSGYLLNGIEKDASGTIEYRGVGIPRYENSIGQNVYDKDNQNDSITVNFDTDNDGIGDDEVKVGSIEEYPCVKENGVKYYYNTTYGGNKTEIFSILNEEKYVQEIKDKDIMTDYINDLGYQYYNEAFEFTDKVLNEYGLKDLMASSAVDQAGNAYSSEVYYDYKIFDSSNDVYIQDENSNFNAHRTQVIQNTIETALIPAISNYSDVSTTTTQFSMPRLSEYEWNQVANNVTMISFMQGFNIGGKIYNGHSVVTNNSNEEFVSEDSIYILVPATDSQNGTYYRVTDSVLLDTLNLTNAVGVFNADFQRRMVDAVYEVGKDTPTTADDYKYSKTLYYYPRWDTGAYTSIINPNTDEGAEQSIDEYLADKPELAQIAQIYYTALGRERMGMYRVNNIVN